MMHNSTTLSKEALKDLIQLLRKRRSIEQESFRTEWHKSIQYLKLGNFVQESISAITSPKARSDENNLVKNMIGLSTGFLINKIYPNKPKGIIAKISKLSFEIIAGKLVANNSDKIVSIGLFLIKKLISKKQTHS